MPDLVLSRTYSSASGEVRWERFGDDEGDPVVLLHGTPFSSYIWRGTVRALSRYHQVFVWDMPGYGASEKFPGQDLSLDALEGVFLGLLQHWKLTEPAVVAHDTGGAIALGTHFRRGVRYRKLALVDAVALAPWGSPFFELVGEYPHAFNRLPPTLHRALLREYVNSASSPGLHAATLDALTKPWLSRQGQDAFYYQLSERVADTEHVDELQRRYAATDFPVLVCWGEDDAWIPADRGRELAARIQAASFETIPGAGHLVQEDGPAELTAALLGFLLSQC